MELTPQRKHGESFEAYRRRRAIENERVAHYLRHGVAPTWLNARPKLGKAATKRAKRARRDTRRAEAAARTQALQGPSEPDGDYLDRVCRELDEARAHG
jgi:hypothetical protein